MFRLINPAFQETPSLVSSILSPHIKLLLGDVKECLKRQSEHFAAAHNYIFPSMPDFLLLSFRGFFTGVIKQFLAFFFSCYTQPLVRSRNNMQEIWLIFWKDLHILVCVLEN